MTDAKQTADDEQAVHRLRDIVVEEVSLVDRAANKRRFLVVKRSDAMANPDILDEDDETEEDVAQKADATDAAASSEVDAEVHAMPEKAKAPKKKKQAKGALPAVTEALKRLMAVAKGLQQSPNMDVSVELEGVATLLGKKDTDKAPVAKVGARMAKTRLERFHKAVELLSAILEELTDADDVDGEEMVPTAGAAEAKPPPEAAAHSPMVADLVSEMQKLARVVKRQEEELSGLRQARGVSNAIQVDSARRAESQDVSWPFDMNRPISRDKVRKEVSFFDE
jgi:hypothetical protein